MMLRAALAACFILAALPAAQAQSFKTGDPVSVTAVDVVFTDGVVPTSHDTAATKFIEKFSAEKKAAFEAFAAPRGLSAATTGERVAEFLAIENLRARLTNLTGDRKVKVEVTVQKARPKNMLNPVGVAFTLPGQMTQTLSFTARIVDEATGEVVGKIDAPNSAGAPGDAQEAEKINGLNYDTMGFDTNFRVLAGLTNALARRTALYVYGPSAPASKAP